MASSKKPKRKSSKKKSPKRKSPKRKSSKKKSPKLGRLNTGRCANRKMAGSCKSNPNCKWSGKKCSLNKKDGETKYGPSLPPF